MNEIVLCKKALFSKVNGTGKDQKAQIVCSKCSQTFTLRSSLTRHMRLHTGQFKFYCDKCKKGFLIKHGYIEHMRKHEGLKYHCDYCAKPFMTKTAYQYHLSVHTGSYRFACERCNKGFNEQRGLFKTYRESGIR